MEKIQTRVAQMNKIEWDKCKDGQRFNVSIITKTNKKITLEDIMHEIVGMKADINELKQDNIKTKATLEEIKNEIVVIKSDIANLKRDVIRIDARLTRVIQLNNLRE